ncbi:MAG TPA: UDP-N-acetylmuramate--L-alanine ligase [Candidatus Nitrosotalea sp.]|nr:UDP-N-acetylmuramate--L-alanine ligase [Candidatus Nitrosotalea sp.]
MRVHLIGLGGSGVSALAKVYAARGDEVSGCDLIASKTTELLARSGIRSLVGHDPEHVSGQDLVVYSGAARSAAAEIEEAHRCGIEVLSRAQCLARLIGQQRSVAVAGSHGKTTVTLMLGRILEAAGWDPTILVGDGGSSRAGSSDWLVAEADESDGTLVLHHPQHALVTNVEFDHPDHFADLDQVRGVFAEFLARLPATGLAVVCADDPLAAALGTSGRRVTYGFDPSADWVCRPQAGGGAEVRPPSGGTMALRLGVPGRHNLQNATGALAMACELGIPPKVGLESLAGFTGARRRLERLGQYRGASIFDDYAHHPTEIRAVLEAARALGGERVLAVFQPHRYSRYEAFEREFGAALSGADAALVCEIYGAGEPNPRELSSRRLAETIGVDFAPDLAAVGSWVRSRARPKDVVLLMGAGDLREVGDGLAERG